MIDNRKHEEWGSCLAATHYFMPICRTMSWRELSKELTKLGEGIFFDDDKKSL
ncbi:hypothetical protein FFI94_032075 [Rhodococcus sp. KBS0724]|nr:hypothetical protein FFI94_032075 [Rhodococcus sp. KBS0724]